MTIPDNLIKRLLELLDENNYYLFAYKDEVDEEEIEVHRKALWSLKWEIEENAKE